MLTNEFNDIQTPILEKTSPENKKRLFFFMDGVQLPQG